MFILISTRYIHIFLLIIFNGYVDALDKENPASEFSRHRLVHPTVYHGRTKREIVSTRYTTGVHHPDITVDLKTSNEVYTLDLKLNEELVSDDHVISYQKHGKTVLQKPTKEELDICQYSGTIRGKPGSWVAVSTCHGLRGILYDGHQMRYIEPTQGNDISSTHFLYDHSDFAKISDCGVSKHSDGPSTDKIKIRRNKREVVEYDVVDEVRGPFNANKLMRYVELVLVADRATYQDNGENLDVVHRHLKDVANIINSIYAPLNIYIALVGVVVWTERNEIAIESDGDKTLTNFLKYRKDRLTVDIPNDNAQLLTHHKFTDGVLGKALKGPICSYQFSGGVSTNHSQITGLVASTIAHMIGHNFGIEHDAGPDCECPDEKCIMSPSVSSVTTTHWSSCSLQYLAMAFDRGMDYCLRNKPKRLFDSPTCGNGFLESGEECDCGLHPSPECSACCRASECQLQPNATCAVGDCCDFQTCRPRTAGTVCRSAERECDLPEFCTGHSEFCPRDLHKMDATPCSNGQAYCVGGHCRTHTDQCQLLWGSTGKNSNDGCYNNNIKGTMYGNCGYNPRTAEYQRCRHEDILCGRLHCRHLSERLEFGFEAVATLSATFIVYNGSVQACRTSAVDMGLGDVDPGLVPDGAKCGDNMMCFQQRCVSTEAILETAYKKVMSVCPSNCSGQGVCNSEGHCHCKPGFAPPLCDRPGFGGSQDSGPAMSQKSINQNNL